jgi:hypothetical protein
MKVVRMDRDHIQIFPEEMSKIFEEALGWTGKEKLNSILCELKGYGVE